MSFSALEIWFVRDGGSKFWTSFSSAERETRFLIRRWNWGGGTLLKRFGKGLKPELDVSGGHDGRGSTGRPILTKSSFLFFFYRDKFFFGIPFNSTFSQRTCGYTGNSLAECAAVMAMDWLGVKFHNIITVASYRLMYCLYCGRIIDLFDNRNNTIVRGYDVIFLLERTRRLKITIKTAIL